MSSLVTPLNRAPMLSPASAKSNCFLNISTPVTTTSSGLSFSPTISTLSLTFTTPLSTLPVATVPLPVIENTSSTLIKNGLSTSLCGNFIFSSIASISAIIESTPSLSPCNAFNALPLIIAVLSPSNPYFVNNSLTSISTKSNNSLSSTASHLFKNTTM